MIIYKYFFNILKIFSVLWNGYLFYGNIGLIDFPGPLNRFHKADADYVQLPLG